MHLNYEDRALDKKKVAIIGSGVSGLVAAKKLQAKFATTIFDKARGVGGRLSTKYNALGHQFDMGAQFFTVGDEDFNAFIAPYVSSGVLQPWLGKFISIESGKLVVDREWTADRPHYVGSPKMTSWCKAMAEGLNVKLGCKVVRIENLEDGKYIIADDGAQYGPYEYLLLAVPVAQAIELLPDNCNFKDILAQYNMTSCFSMLLGYEVNIDIDFAAAIIKNSKISLIANNNSKPGREECKPSLTVLSTKEFAANNCDVELDEVQRQLCSEVADVLGINLPIASYQHLHYWRYCNHKRTYGPKHYFDSLNNIGICGDWLLKGIVECAYKSADSLSAAVLGE